MSKATLDLGFFAAAAVDEEEDDDEHALDGNGSGGGDGGDAMDVDAGADADNDYALGPGSVDGLSGAKKASVTVTVSEIESNAVTRAAHAHWLFTAASDASTSTTPTSAKGKQKPQKQKKQKVPQLSSELLKEMWAEVAAGPRGAVLLDLNQYLEMYLWPVFISKDPSPLHVLSIAAMINEKCRAKVSHSPFTVLTSDPIKFAIFFKALLKNLLADDTELDARRTLLVTLINAFQSFENDVVRLECAKIVGVSTWHSLRDGEKLEAEFGKNVGLRKAWNKAEKKRASSGATEEDIFNEQFFISALIKLYFKTLATIPSKPSAAHHASAILFCERSLELFTDLLAQLTTRRFLAVLFADHYIAQTSVHSALAARGRESVRTGSAAGVLSGSAFAQLLEMYEAYEAFEVDAVSGLAVSRDEAVLAQAMALQAMQKVCFVKFRTVLEEFALTSGGVLSRADVFEAHLEKVCREKGEEGEEAVRGLAFELGFRIVKVGEEDEEDSEKYEVGFLVEALARTYCQRERQLDLVNSLSVYPNETDLFDDLHAPDSYGFLNNHCLPIPKLNLQFLTMHDYLLRNFNLYRLETAYEIRQDVEDAVKRLAPKYAPDVDSLTGSTIFTGWARMACQIERFEVTEVGPSALGDTKPSFVLGELSFVIGRYSDAIRREWESIKKHDVLFLISISVDPDLPAWNTKAGAESAAKSALPFRRQFGIKNVRGCVVVDELDAGDKIGAQETGDGDEAEKQPPRGHRRMYNRTLRVSLDPNQYERDMARVTRKEGPDVHGTFNIVLRRKGAENNFKSVLESIRDLMQCSEIVVPDWLHDVILGYGDPAGARFDKMKEPVTRIDFRDTFLDFEHAVESFPGKTLAPVEVKTKMQPPFVLTFPDRMYEALAGKPAEEPAARVKHGKRKQKDVAEKVDDSVVVKVETYKPLNMGPFPADAPRLNQIRFTPKQVEAIQAGTSNGLTLVVGPPGTGKTDTTVQIIANIYHNFPNEKTLLITHSNQALNQLFEKIVDLDIDPRHVLRLGHGMEELKSEESWGKYGRVNSFLEKRIQLLAQVDTLAASLSIPGAHGYTCETAQNFFNQYISRYWDRFHIVLKSPDVTVQKLNDSFPFHYYFSTAPSPLFYKGQTLEEAVETVEGCYRHISKIFTELEEVRAFELLRNNHDRSNYLLIKEAKIVALTCTHAALKRRELVAIGFKYHNVIMEEAAQILEVEAFIPLLLQSVDQDTGLSRLKRVVMVGDHHQLPPVVQNSAFQKYGNMEQSLFARLVRLGVPAVELDQQGRCRSSLADLFRWNYTALDDLGLIKKAARSEFSLANPGFAFDAQFVNVEDYNGQGETEPMAHFLQNLGEAEYVVATYQYMRLLGYPASKISILTSYNGQKALIEDVLEKRCRWNPLFGLPADVATVDRFQGQQNDYILLSLVRTKTVGHLRDVRRLIVALSRARLGLYIFGRQKLFQNCLELQEAFGNRLFKDRPTQELWLRGGELYVSDDFSRLVEDTGVVHEGGEWSVAGEEDSIFKIADVAHMGTYVHQMIVEQIEFMKTEKEKKAKDAEDAAEAAARESDEGGEGDD
ncbi:hypothetical protein BC830DRAFT_1168644 [Chytriomyces sp. MP71]|nr:hypothetical protein BC830DRAFT_1168644 [Chytriomyces sp. MP71]